MRFILVIYFLLMFSTSSVMSQNSFDIYFDFNDDKINVTSQNKLNTWIAENSDIVVTRIYGFCDWIGSNSYNDSLSIRRVKSVFSYLKNYNISIDPYYLEKGFGKNFEQSAIQDENRKVKIYYRYNLSTNVNSQVDHQYKLSLTTKIYDSKIGSIIELEDLLFKNNLSILQPQSKAVLDELVCVLKENPTIKIKILGHICCKTEGDLSKLSEQRARVVMSYLIRNKISKKRISYIGMGTSSPKFPIPEKNISEEFANRRVEILIVDK